MGWAQPAKSRLALEPRGVPAVRDQRFNVYASRTSS